jgi:hypothetical protein
MVAWVRCAGAAVCARMVPPWVPPGNLGDLGDALTERGLRTDAPSTIIFG